MKTFGGQNLGALQLSGKTHIAAVEVGCHIDSSGLGQKGTLCAWYRDPLLGGKVLVWGLSPAQ